MSSAVDAMGGYFELELPPSTTLPYSAAYQFQSARAAFLALIRAGRPQRIWMPKYICDSMVAPLEIENIECVWYDVNDQLSIPDKIQLNSNDWLLYVNYFGVCNKHVRKVLQRFRPNKIIMDCSQAFFSPPAKDALATIYSPRKFFGLPDGGLLVTEIPIILPEIEDTGSLKRTAHLMRRIADSPEAGYSDYQDAEKSLKQCEPKKMSSLTKNIFKSIDFENARKKRQKNFLFLHERLAGESQYNMPDIYDLAPLCYPFVTNDITLRDRLISNRVYIATYWPDAMDRVDAAWSQKMITGLFPLPIDQRYGRKDLERLVSIIRGDIV